MGRYLRAPLIVMREVSPFSSVIPFSHRARVSETIVFTVLLMASSKP